LTAAFSGPSQEIGLARILAGHALDLKGKTLTAKIRLASGLSTDTANLGTAKIYVATGDQYVCGIGVPTSLTPGGDWVTLSLSGDSPNYTCSSTSGSYDASQVNELGIIIDTGTVGSYTAGTLYVDSIAMGP
jgi:hypothetical protein